MKRLSPHEQIALFWSRVAKAGPDDCWPWTAGMAGTGYGIMRFGDEPRNTHTIAFELTFGVRIKLPLCVLHRCDNRPCCNPGHFFIGTKGDNIRDCVAKGRHISGTAILTRSAVEQAVQMVADGKMHQDVARMLGVSRQAISLIVQGRSWGNITGIKVTKRPTWRDKVTTEDVQEMRRMRSKGVPFRQIAAIFGIAHMAVVRLVSPK